jgi:hypothetical protein
MFGEPSVGFVAQLNCVPDSHKFPDVSVRLALLLRSPETMLGAAIPRVPYLPGWHDIFDPPPKPTRSPLYVNRSFWIPNAARLADLLSDFVCLLSSNQPPR